MKIGQFFTKYTSRRKKFSIESQMEEVKPAVSELFEIDNRENLISVPILQTLDKQELESCFKASKQMVVWNLSPFTYKNFSVQTMME